MEFSRGAGVRRTAAGTFMPRANQRRSSPRRSVSTSSGSRRPSRSTCVSTRGSKKNAGRTRSSHSSMARDDCDDLAERKRWDRKLGLGRQKIFEVRKIYNDLTFIDEFLTEEFAVDQKMFTFEYNKQAGEYVIASREFKMVKEKLLFQLTNWGNPFIRVENANYENRGELYLFHKHEGLDLKLDMTKDTPRNVHPIW